MREWANRTKDEDREEKALVTLGGTAITKSGKLTKSNYFRFLDIDLDDYDDIKMTAGEARKIEAHLRKLSTGASALVPLYCGGNERCPFADRCPLVKIGAPPVGKQCIIESQLIKEFIMRYFEEYDVDPESFTEVGFISELAEIEILLMRLNMNLAKPENAELVIDQIAGVTQDGTPLVRKELSPFMEQREKLLNRKSKIIQLMVGDRREKYKKEAALKIKLEQDPSSQMAIMRAKLEELARGLRLEEKSGLSPQDVIDAEFEDPVDDE